MIPFPYNLIGVLALLAGAFFGGWTAQGWHRDSQEIDRAETNLESERLAGQARTANETRVVKAQNAATSRAADARADATDARTELERVRALSDAAIDAARVSNEACLDRAIALNDVFKSCSGRYAELGEKATRHASDLQTLTDAWPETKP